METQVSIFQEGQWKKVSFFFILIFYIFVITFFLKRTLFSNIPLEHALKCIRVNSVAKKSAISFKYHLSIGDSRMFLTHPSKNNKTKKNQEKEILCINSTGNISLEMYENGKIVNLLFIFFYFLFF